jgi:hypothetical protein
MESVDDESDLGEDDTAESLRNKVKHAKAEANELRGWQALKTGEWHFKLKKKSFNNYRERGNAEYFKNEYYSTLHEREPDLRADHSTFFQSTSCPRSNSLLR